MRSRIPLLLVVSGLLIAGCGDDDADPGFTPVEAWCVGFTDALEASFEPSPSSAELQASLRDCVEGSLPTSVVATGCPTC